MQLDPKYGDILLHQWIRLAGEGGLSDKEKFLQLYEFLENIIIEATDQSGLNFHTMYTRMAYIGSVIKLPQGLLYNMHTVRREFFRWTGQESNALTEHLDLVVRIGADLICALYGLKLTPLQSEQLPDRSVYLQSEYTDMHHVDEKRVVVTGLNLKDKNLIVLPEGEELEVKVRYDVTGKNDPFTNTVHIIDQYFDLPVSMNLIDIEIQSDGKWLPSAMVLLPDYLIDVTAVADSLKADGVSTLSYVLRRFLPKPTNIPILTGNIVNFFLDEMVSDPTVGFTDLKKKLFHLAPLSFAQISDGELRELFQKLQRHFITIYQLMRGGFQKHGIRPESSVLEPTFYSDRYGLQGRLDLYDPGENGKASIVELKSGKPFKPNKYGLNQSHYLQTLMYDLLVKSVFGGRVRPTSYILYSVMEGDVLKFAPVVKAQQYEALAARNELIGVDMQLSLLNDMTDPDQNFISGINADGYKGLYGFLLRDVMHFGGVYQRLSKIEKHYFLTFVGMIAREHQLAKVGKAGKEGVQGQAALWQKAMAQKESAFEILKDLHIKSNLAYDDDPIIILSKTSSTNPLANFRVGDIVVLYPAREEGPEPTSEQLIKCSIIALDDEEVRLRLRAKQTNDLFFNKYKVWNIEQDVLDSSFMGLTRGLFEWANAPVEVRQKLLGLTPPKNNKQQSDIQLPNDLTEEQSGIIKSIIHAEDYFLLWGPPGTGKTSKMLHHLVKYLTEHTEERLLLLAFTNRAVDEMCAAISTISQEIAEGYIRIGSRYGADEKYRHLLLDRKAEDCSTREELKQMLSKSRIIIGTMASIQGKPELFDLLSFDRLIVDEASQILEPSMIGMMVKFDKVLLIGDHLQLPAVVTQSPDKTKIQNSILREDMDLYDAGDSLFERLYRRAIKMKWDWAYARLSHQGRMHHEIMTFPNENFYGNGLKVLPLDTDRHFQLEEMVEVKGTIDMSGWKKKLCNRRVNFIPTTTDNNHVMGKVNTKEASLVVDIIEFYCDAFGFDQDQIGVITPYRAQIATIKHEARKRRIDVDKVQIDTVERFQGGARDVIIISLCANYIYQLGQLVSLSTDGVDRKFNVALTRARKHLVVLGNPEVLQKDERYRVFMTKYRV